MTVAPGAAVFVAGTTCQHSRMARPLPPWMTCLLFAVLLPASVPVAAVDDDTTTFAAPSPLATTTELARRTQTPVTFDRLQRYLATAEVVLPEQPVDVTEERYDVVMPRSAPPGGRYALLVWISPHGRNPSPHAWRDALDRHGMILVSARRGGNNQGTLERRLPLALHAAHNLMQLHDIDPARVYAGGFSGGARAALRLAVGFPDVFRGALLGAGSDPLGGGAMSPPPADLLATLQERGRLVWVTGARDLPNRRMEGTSRASMVAHCIDDLHSVSMGGAEHAPPDRRSFARALDLLDPLQGDTHLRAGSLAQCRAGLAAQVDAALLEVETLLARGDIDAAGERLGALDLRWGGLAAPRSVELARRLAALRPAANEAASEVATDGR